MRERKTFDARSANGLNMHHAIAVTHESMTVWKWALSEYTGCQVAESHAYRPFLTSVLLRACSLPAVHSRGAADPALCCVPGAGWD